MPNYKGLHEHELQENGRLRHLLEQVERENARLIEELSQTKKEVTDREVERDEARGLLREIREHPNDPGRKLKIDDHLRGEGD